MPPNRFEVDLTSVCVRSGAVQLPFRLQGAFAEGPVAAVDADGGATLDLRFRPPRELLGLLPFFEAHELRANDRIGLVFTDAGLRVEAIKRERKAPVRGPQRAQGAQARGERTSPAPAVHDRSRRASGEVRRGSGPAAPPDRAPETSSSTAASSAPPSLRMASPAPSVPAEEHPGHEPRDRAVPRWEPLDVTATPGVEGAGAESGHGGGAPPSVEDTQARAGDDGTPRVREIRRGTLLGAPPSHAPDAPGGEARERNASDDIAAAARRTTGAERHEDEPSPGPHQGRGLDLFGLRRRFGFGRAERGRQQGDPPSAGRRGGPAQRAPQAPGSEATSDAVDPTGPVDVAWAQPEAAAPRATAVGVADPSATPSPMPSEEDLTAVAAYLARPEVPAIVRAERVAEELALSFERADAALDRISEASDHLSRIRAGAYMLRRRAQP